jgi:hypothetical protein
MSDDEEMSWTAKVIFICLIASIFWFGGSLMTLIFKIDSLK